MRRQPEGEALGPAPWRRDRLPTPVFLGFPGGSAGEESACNVEDGGTTWFFSSYGGILELRRGFQASSCVGPGHSQAVV